MTYFKHLAKNWRVSAHATKDAFAHFIHGLLPFIKIKHHQPIPEAREIIQNVTVYEEIPVKLQAEIFVFDEFLETVPEDFIKNELAKRFLERIKELMEIRRFFEPELNRTRFVALLKVLRQGGNDNV